MLNDTLIHSDPAIIASVEEEGFQDDGIHEDVEAEEDETQRRGKDREWNLVATFQSNDEYEQSDLYLSELMKMSMRKARSTLYADRETFECKFSRKKSFLPCTLKYRVNFDSSSFEITVEKNGDSHVHEKDTEYGENGNQQYFRWSEEQTNIIVAGVKNELDPTVIKRNMKESNLFSVGKWPTSLQISNKIAHCRLKLVKQSIVSTGDLREAIAKKWPMVQRISPSQ